MNRTSNLHRGSLIYMLLTLLSACSCTTQAKMATRLHLHILQYAPKSLQLGLLYLAKTKNRLEKKKFRGDPLPRSISAVGLINSYDATQEATDLPTASTLVKRNSNGDTQVSKLTAVYAAIKSGATNLITLQAPASIAESFTLTLPTTAGTNGYVLSTNGSGTLSWISVPTAGSTILQGGNTLGTTVSIGSNDDYGLSFKTNNTERLAISNAGTTTVSGTLNITSSVEGNTSNILNIGTSASSATINIGTGVTTNTINIGGSGDTINLYGTTYYNQVTDLQIADKNITLNKGGAASSATNAGLDIEEDSSTTGYCRTSADRTAWQLKAPASNGIVTITPGASGFSLNQGVATTDSPTFANLTVTTNETIGNQLWIKGGNGDVGPLLYSLYDGNDSACFAFNRDKTGARSNNGYGQAVLHLRGNGQGRAFISLTDGLDETLVERFALHKDACRIATAATTITGTLGVTGATTLSGTLTLPTDFQMLSGAQGIFHQYGATTNIFVGGAGNRTLAVAPANPRAVHNVGTGLSSLIGLTTGSFNTATGTSSLSACTTGLNNCAYGHAALNLLQNGSSNIAIGTSAGSAITTTSNNIMIGAAGVASDSGVIRIGSSSQTTCFLNGIYGNTEPAATIRRLVYATDGHQLGTTTTTGTVTTDGNLQIKGNYAPTVPLASAATPRILYGYINSAGIKQTGSDGWNVDKLETGKFKITFTPAFTGIPSLTVAAYANTENPNMRYDTYIYNMKPGEAMIYIIDPTVSWYDVNFSFQAIGV